MCRFAIWRCLGVCRPAGAGEAHRHRAVIECTARSALFPGTYRLPWTVTQYPADFKVPFAKKIRSLATDSVATSVMLARVILAENSASPSPHRARRSGADAGEADAAC